MMKRGIGITADYREFQSGIPTSLLERNIVVNLENLPAGDYLINNQLLVERKTAEDFIISLISNRLFLQCEKLKKNSDYHFLMIEGNPYKTRHKVSREAVKGALLSISSAWQIPVVFSKDKNDTVELLISTGNQILKHNLLRIRAGIKPKRLKNRQLYLLQGLPDIGPALAYRLLIHFGSLQKIMRATEKQLLKVDGIGNKKASRLVEFFKAEFDKDITG